MITTDSALESPATSAPPVVITGGEALTIYTVENWLASCRAQLERCSLVVIDLADVTACDTLGVQALCAIRKGADAGGKSVRFANASPAVEQAARAIFCESLFTPNTVGS